MPELSGYDNTIVIGGKFIKAVLFDIDGTLLKCHGAGKDALVRACKETYGTAGDMESINFQGKTDPLIVQESLIPQGFNEHEINDKIEQMKKQYFLYLKKNMISFNPELLPGVKNILINLSIDKSIIMGILTGNFSEGACIKLETFNLHRFFSFGVYSDTIPIRNEMPGQAREILLKKFNLDISYENFIIIGDTVHDIECARSVGAVSIIVGTGWSDKKTLLAHHPDYYLDNLIDSDRIVEIIKGININ